MLQIRRLTSLCWKKFLAKPCGMFRFRRRMWMEESQESTFLSLKFLFLLTAIRGAERP